MRIVILVAGLLSAIISFGQSVQKQKTAIDSIVSSIELDQGKISYRFSVKSPRKALNNIKYHYQTKKGSIVKITRNFGVLNDSTEQVFYFNYGQLIFTTEVISSYEDEKRTEVSLVWTGEYYFTKGKLIYYITNGHGKSETEDWNPQLEVMNNCKSAKNDIGKYIAKKKGANILFN